MISANQVRRALALLGWATPTLAKRAQISFEEATMARNDVKILHLGGLQIGAIQRAFEEAGIEFAVDDDSGTGGRPQKVEG